MKLNKEEATLLAQEVYNKLKSMGIGVVSKPLIAKINTYKEKYEKLKAAETKASEALEQHENTWEDIVCVKGAYASDSVPRIIQKIKESSVPSIDQIRNKIILRGLFNQDKDMDTFISDMVKEFSKKNVLAAH